MAGLTSALLAGAAPAESLADAMVAAYNHSGLLEQNRAALRAADEDVAQAVASLRPVISYTATAGYNASAANNNTRDLGASASLDFSWLIFDSGARAFQREGLKEIVLATRQSLIGIEQDVLLAAVNAYMGVVRETETVALRENNVRLITQELRAAEDRFEVGEVTRTDVAQAEARLAQARASLAAARGALVQARAQYQNDVGRMPGALSTPRSTPRLPGDLGAARGIARSGHPDIKASQHLISSAELFVENARAGLKPNIRGSASLGLSDGGNTSDSLALTLNQTLYAGGANLSAIRAAEAAVEQRRAQLHLTRHGVDLGVSASYASLDIARATLEAGERQVRASTIAFRGVREEATLGSRTTLDVLDAEQDLLDAQVNVIRAAADEVAAVYAVLSSLGKLTVKDLGLPVKTYDPAAYYNMVKDAPNGLSDQGAALERVLKGLGKN